MGERPSGIMRILPTSDDPTRYFWIVCKVDGSEVAKSTHMFPRRSSARLSFHRHRERMAGNIVEVQVPVQRRKKAG